MDHEVPSPAAKAQRGNLPWAAVLVEGEPHVPRRLIVIDLYLFGALNPHADHFISTQATLEGGLMNLHMYQ
ncbi:MAG: hypothetical protein ACTHXA_13290 [Gulosibacter sp.]|uniref:hypothetical protein n=1 Tax=Gulosibacter sp. TaxID=2817531 RepID=UPI003F9339BC